MNCCTSHTRQTTMSTPAPPASLQAGDKVVVKVAPGVTMQGVIQRTEVVYHVNCRLSATRSMFQILKRSDLTLAKVSEETE